MTGDVFTSIHLSSNRPEQIRCFIDHVERNADAPEAVEILIHIDEGDSAMEAALIHEQQTRRVQVRYLKTDLVHGFGDLWKCYNPLFQLTHAGAQFVILVSDEMLFESKGWDSIIKQYAGYYPDNIFRLRASAYRFRNYTDFWECGFAPDSLAFYTRDWLALQGDWNPCAGPDSFQQCVAFYLQTSEPFNHVQYNRDIPVAELRFSGEGASKGLSGMALRRRQRINMRAWFVLMSQPMQQEAKRRAMHLQATILCRGIATPTRMEEDTRKRCIQVLDAGNGTVLHTLPYGLSRLRIGFTTLYRAPLFQYYAGGGAETFKQRTWLGLFYLIDTYVPNGERILHVLGKIRRAYERNAATGRHRRNHIRGVWKTHGIMAGILALCTVIAQAMLPASAYNRLLHHGQRLKDRRNHVIGTLRHHGVMHGLQVLWKGWRA